MKASQLKIDSLISFLGDVWRVVNLGATNADGHVYMHLASTTRGTQQKNGFYAIQMADYINLDKI